MAAAFALVAAVSLAVAALRRARVLLDFSEVVGSERIVKNKLRYSLRCFEQRNAIFHHDTQRRTHALGLSHPGHSSRTAVHRLDDHGPALMRIKGS